MKRSSKKIWLRTLALVLAIAIFTGTALFASDLITGELTFLGHADAVPILEGELRGMTVRTVNNEDFPSKPGLSSKAMRSELDDIVSFASQYGFNAIFFEAVPQGDALYRSSFLPASVYWAGKQDGFTFFDPLHYLVDTASKENIQVYAVVNPFGIDAQNDLLSEKSIAKTNPELVTQNGFLNPSEKAVQELTANVAGELTQNYKIAGVLIDGVDSELYDSVPAYSQAVADLLAAAHKKIDSPATQRLGLAVSGDDIFSSTPRNLYSAPLKDKSIDFLVTSFSFSMHNELDSLIDYSAAWEKLAAEHEVALYSSHFSYEDNARMHEIDTSLYFEREAGYDGIVVGRYRTLNEGDRLAATSLSATFERPITGIEPMEYPQTFEIGRPDKDITTTFAQYYITGTSDPNEPLYYDGEEVERFSTTGLWGVLVDVPVGKNTYTFSQGGASKSISLERKDPNAAPATISAITKSSAFPASSEIVFEGKELKLSCTAPAGGTVNAKIGGLTAALEQVAAAEDGTPATYQATIDVSSLAAAGQVKNIGTVTYSLNYSGLNSTQPSSGSVYVVGASAKPVGEINRGFAPVNENAADDGKYHVVLKQGCVDYITASEGNYYQLSGGGYVAKSLVKVLEGTASPVSNVASVTLEITDRGEKLKIAGTARPAFYGKWEDGVVQVTLHNLSGFEGIDTTTLKSELCSSIESEVTENGSVVLTFNLNSNTRLLGWNVVYDGNDTFVYLKERPAVPSGTTDPLSGVVVAIDPGHGGSDPGAGGIPYLNGAWEREFNLSNAAVLKQRLEAFGATVHILHDNADMTLDERMALTDAYDADIFISCHHNSSNENNDTNEVNGIEVYYYNDQSAPFAEDIGNFLSAVTGRTLRFTEQTYFRVTMTPACPAVLIESGYVVSPSEYEKLATVYDQLSYGYAVADAVVEIFTE